MAAPLVISFTLRFLFTFVDLAYAAVLRDDNASLAAIGFYAPVQSIFIALWVGLSAGFTASLANAFGHRDTARIDQLKRSMLRMLSILIPVLSVVIGSTVWLVTPYLGLEPRMADAFRIYATTLTVGMPLAGFWSIYPDSIVKAHQDTRSTMVAGIASTITNVVLNTLFVFGFGWGIFGIAFATILSRFSGLFYAMYRARVLEREREAEGWTSQTPEWPAPLSTILRLSVPGAVTWLLQALEAVVINKLLLGLPDSTTAIASFAVYNQMLMFALMPAAGTSVAVVPYVARVLPEDGPARIRQDLRTTVSYIMLLAGVLTVCMGWLFAEPLADFFVQRQTGEDATGASSSTVDALRLLPLSALAAVPFLVLRPVFEAAHLPRIGVQVSVARFVLLSPPLMLAGRYVGPEIGLDGLRGIILGLVASAALATLWTVRQARWVLRSSEPAES